MRPPLTLEGPRRKRALWITGALALGLFAVLGVLDARLTEDGAPGIVPFEMAGSEERAREILGEWGEDRHDTARASLIVDFPYLVVYSAFLALAVTAVADASRRPRLARIGPALAWGALGAGLFDAIEDIALLRMVAGHVDQPNPAIARWAATVKFALAGAALVYVLAGLVVRLVDRRRASPSA